MLTITGLGYIIRKETGLFEANRKNDYKVAVRVSGAISYSVAQKCKPSRSGLKTGKHSRQALGRRGGHAMSTELYFLSNW